MAMIVGSEGYNNGKVISFEFDEKKISYTVTKYFPVLISPYFSFNFQNL